MFDKYIVCEDGFENISEGDQITGFQFKARLPYYRGLGISMVEDLAVKVDGEVIPRQAIQVTLHGNTYTLDEMETEYDDRWADPRPAHIRSRSTPLTSAQSGLPGRRR